MKAITGKYVVHSLFVVFSLFTTGYASGQSSRELQAQRRAIMENIEQTTQLLKETSSSARSSLNRLNLLEQQIKARKNVISLLNREISAIDKEIAELNKELSELEKDLKVKRDSYSRSVQSMYTRRSSQYKWLFVLSANNFAQIVRRMRYVREYADWQKHQASLIMQKQEEINRKQLEIEQSRSEKLSLLRDAEEESKLLAKEEAQQKAEIQELNKKQRELQAEINQRRRQADALNRQIQQLIAKETGSGTATASSADIQLSNDFAANRGRLPFPVSGRYTIVRPYGEYQLQRNVRMRNNGIDIQTTAGAEALAVFNGIVRQIFVVQGQYNVLVRHGSYLTVYANLSEVYVSSGDKVSTSQKLGKIYTDEKDKSTILHFELYKEVERLNPELWLR